MKRIHRLPAQHRKCRTSDCHLPSYRHNGDTWHPVANWGKTNGFTHCDGHPHICGQPNTLLTIPTNLINSRWTYLYNVGAISRHEYLNQIGLTDLSPP